MISEQISLELNNSTGDAFFCRAKASWDLKLSMHLRCPSLLVFAPIVDSEKYDHNGKDKRTQIGELWTSDLVGIVGRGRLSTRSVLIVDGKPACGSSKSSSFVRNIKAKGY